VLGLKSNELDFERAVHALALKRKSALLIGECVCGLPSIACNKTDSRFWNGSVIGVDDDSVNRLR
jgi:hypothetical protein